MLLFSNFSYATGYMLCGMKDNSSVCRCGHKSYEPIKELTFTDKSSSCCNEGTLELVNSNLLSTVKIELPFDISLFTPADANFQSEVSLTSNNNFYIISLAEHVPKDDIPILKSSLLI